MGKKNESMGKTARDILKDGDVPVLLATGPGGDALMYVPRVPCEDTEPANLVARLLDEEPVEWVCYEDEWMLMRRCAGEPRTATLSEALTFENVNSVGGGVYSWMMSKMSEDWAAWGTLYPESLENLRLAQDRAETMEKQVKDLTAMKESVTRRLTGAQMRAGNLVAALIEWADDNGVDSSFDEVLDAQGFEGRKREFGVTMAVTVTVERSVWACSEEEAEKMAAEMASEAVNDWTRGCDVHDVDVTTIRTVQA